MSKLDPVARLKVRLYGGWFREETNSRIAQELIPQIERDYPQTYSVWNDVRTTVEVELARSLAEAPTAIYTHTYRERGLPGTLACAVPPYAGCQNIAACPTMAMNAILSSGGCTVSGCGVTLQSVLTKAEQKLVDAQLMLDILHFSRFKGRCIVVVTSDDDLFPAIHAATLRGARVVHVHPNPGRKSPRHYVKHIAAPAYSETCFEARP